MSLPTPRCRIGLIVDHPARDLAGMVLLARELSRLGIEGVLIPLYEQGVDVPLLRLDALVLNYARQVNHPLAREYHRSGIRLYVLDTEGGVLSDTGRVSPASIARFVKNSCFGALLSGYFFWGEKMRDAFRDERAMSPDRLHLTGCPRFDFYTPAFSLASKPIRTGHVLVNTNFPAVNPRFSTDPASDTSALRDVGFEETYIMQLQVENRKVMAAMIDLVDRLARDLPELQFVVRPHPFERWEVYGDRLGHLANVTVDGSGPVLDALRGAQALLHLNCSTAIEALMLNLPPLAPEWINSEFLRSHASLPGRASRTVTSYKEMRELLASSDPARGFSIDETYQRTAFEFFYRKDGRSAVRVAEILKADCDVWAENPPRSLSLTTAMRGSFARPSRAQRAQAIAASVVGSAMVRDVRSLFQRKRRAKRFDAKDVRAILHSLGGDEGATPRARQAVHPLTGARLSSVEISPDADIERA